MRYRLDYRWLLTTSVVVGVAAAGTAAIVHQGSGGRDLTDPEQSAEMALRASRSRPVTVVEPARLSHDAGAAGAMASAFESEALPPVFTSNPERAREARERDGFTETWGARVTQAAGITGAYSSRDRWVGNGGDGGGFGGFGGVGGGQRATPQTPAAPSHGSGSVTTPRPSTPPRTVPPSPRPQPAPFAPGSPTTGSGAPPTSGPGTGLPPNPPVGPPGDPGGPGGPVNPPQGVPPVPSGPPLSPTPEPASLILFGTGLAGMYGALRRRLR